MDYELCLMHHGVKGMKWGVRRYQNKDGSLTPKGIKRYATKGYAKDAYNESGRVGKVYNKITNAHKYGGRLRYDDATPAERKARAEKYVADRDVKKYTTKGFTKDAYNISGPVGKVWDKLTGAHKYEGQMMYDTATPSQRKARAEKYVSTEKAKDDAARKRKIKIGVAVGASVVAAGLATYGGYKVNKFIRGKDAEIMQSRAREAIRNSMKNARFKAARTADGVAKTVATSTSNRVRDRVNSFFGENAGANNMVTNQANEYAKKAYDKAYKTVYANQYKDTRDKIFKIRYDPNDYRTDNRSFGTAAKNVYNYYKKKKRG